MKETKETRDFRQRLELQQFINVLRDAGNIVETELRFDCRPADKDAEPPIPRRWRWDVALPYCLVVKALGPDDLPRPTVDYIAIEIQGFGGGHQTTRAFKDDLEKNAEAFAQGWTVLTVSRQMIADGSALDVLARRGVRVEAKS